MAEDTKRISLTKSDVNKVIARWYINCEISLNFERMQSIAFTDALLPALKKLYPNKDDLKDAMTRHMELFNTNATAGGLILGTVLAMEEEKANSIDSIPGESIIAVKTGLMGPCAAFGDSFSAGTITTLFILAACSLAQQGNFLGVLVLLLGTMVTLCELILTTKLTYKQGRSAIKNVLGSSLMNSVTEGANILGMTMMGVLTSSMVSLSRPAGDLRRVHDGHPGPAQQPDARPAPDLCALRLLPADQQEREHRQARARHPRGGARPCLLRHRVA